MDNLAIQHHIWMKSQTEVTWLTSGPVHDSLDVKEERSEAHLHQQLVAVVQADAKGKVALKHPLLWTLLSERGHVSS